MAARPGELAPRRMDNRTTQRFHDAKLARINQLVLMTLPFASSDHGGVFFRHAR